ncbi:MAG: hypothetical protein QXR54_01920 [Nanopusillaceae archaeon]
MGLDLESDLNYIVLFDKGNLDIEMKYLSFQSLDEILESFTNFFINLEYLPTVGRIYTDILLPFKIKYENNKLEEDLFFVKKGYLLFKKVGDPLDNVVIRVKTFYNIPIFLEKIKEESYVLQILLDENIILDYILEGRKEVFDILKVPVTTVSVDYFSKSDLKPIEMKNIYLYPIIIEVRNQKDFLNILSRTISEIYRPTLYII